MSFHESGGSIKDYSEVMLPFNREIKAFSVGCESKNAENAENAADTQDASGAADRENAANAANRQDAARTPNAKDAPGAANRKHTGGAADARFAAITPFACHRLLLKYSR
jgi:hypothetical protein